VFRGKKAERRESEEGGVGFIKIDQARAKGWGRRERERDLC